MAIVYRHRKKSNNEVFYIGIGKTEKRANSKYSRNRYWKNIVKKHDYKAEILTKDISWEDAKELEVFLILEYGRRDLNTGPLCNMTDGGEGSLNRIISKETRKKLGWSLGTSLTTEHKEKISKSILGNQYGKGNKGKPSKRKGEKLPKEWREKISKSLMGNQYAKGSKGNKGKKFSDEWRENIRKGRVKSAKIQKLAKELNISYKEAKIKYNKDK